MVGLPFIFGLAIYLLIILGLTLWLLDYHGSQLDDPTKSRNNPQIAEESEASKVIANLTTTNTEMALPETVSTDVEQSKQSEVLGRE